MAQLALLTNLCIISLRICLRLLTKKKCAAVDEDLDVDKDGNNENSGCDSA